MDLLPDVFLEVAGTCEHFWAGGQDDYEYLSIGHDQGVPSKYSISQFLFHTSINMPDIRENRGFGIAESPEIPMAKRPQPLKVRGSANRGGQKSFFQYET